MRLPRSIASVLALVLLTVGCGSRDDTDERTEAITAGSAIGSEAVDARIDADDDCYDESCWTDQWDEDDEGFDEHSIAAVAIEEPAVVAADAAVVPGDAAVPHDAGMPGDAAAMADGGAPADGPPCAGQAEPACPMPPGGYLPVNPGIPSRALCRGACGGDCPATCVATAGTTQCLEWQTADCQWHAKVCTYPTRRCGSHAGCRVHDACYDACATARFPATCRRGCDLSCIRRWGVRRCRAWMRGNPPYDSWLEYAGTPTSYTYDSTCY